jgi:16S rRNA (guanine(966)-N(2))-methyltransferase RsmD
MAREGLFNVLHHQNLIEGKNVLDLFFGVGGLTLEFVSRGAHSVTAVDVSPASKKHLFDLKKEWELDNLKIVQADVFKLLKKPKGEFDIVIADPPYADPRMSKMPNLVLGTGWIDGSGLFILEHGKETDFSNHQNLVAQHNFGNVHFSFFKV